MVVQQSMDCFMCIVADRMNLWGKLLARSGWMPIQQGLNLIVMFFKKRTDALLLI